MVFLADLCAVGPPQPQTHKAASHLPHIFAATETAPRSEAQAAESGPKAPLPDQRGGEQSALGSRALPGKAQTGSVRCVRSRVRFPCQ